MTDNKKQCWLMEGCPSRTGVCYSCAPDGDDCPIWRWFKKQIVVQCKDCQWYDEKISFCNNCNLPREQTFFCADGKRRTDDA